MIAVVVALALAIGTAGEALWENRRAEEGINAWWCAMYGDALLLAKAEEGEEIPEDEKTVVFVWPLWDSLLRFLGFR